ncbi:MAG: HipA domain-containing protein [Crocinitomicaceae bacterium]|nr:HipA domain-containing protein [Crocinitomicaceae bacterium]MBK8926449.1 HipA domain-containing protein [Crocinitomicaceae bacterium]
MKNKCLYCYEAIEKGYDFHEECSVKFFGLKIPPIIEYSLNEMTALAETVVERSITVPGVQPKLSMSLEKKVTLKSDTRLTVIGALGGSYIFKPPTDRFPEMPENEHLTMRVAEIFGIRVVPSSLIRLASGELAYITRRIDRTDKGEKIHMLDMFQITEAFDKYKSSLEKIGKAIEQFSDNTVLDKIIFFELSLFTFLTGNNDMHLKNFSMIERSSGWTLAPAYDLLNVTILNPEDDEELALTLAGKKKKLKREHFEGLGTGLGLNKKQVENAFYRIEKNLDEALKFIDESFLSKGMKAEYKTVMQNRAHRLIPRS